MRPLIRSISLAAAASIFACILCQVPATAAPTSIPPNAIGGSVLPNLLIVMDNSGSMTWDAHTGIYDETTGTYSYDPLTRYDGIFNSTLRYHYVDGDNFNSARYFEESSGGEWSGNFLNWAAMGRIDIARKVLTGGAKVEYGGLSFITSNAHAVHTSSGGPLTKRYGDHDQVIDFNGTTAFQTPHHATTEGGVYEYIRETVDFDVQYDGLKCGRIRVQDTDAATEDSLYYVRLLVSAEYQPQGVLHRLRDQANVGLMHFCNTEGGYIAKYVRKFSEAHLDEVVAHINLPYGYSGGATTYNLGIDTTWTPLAETLFWATRYFQQYENYFYGTSYSFPPSSPTRYILADSANPWRDPLYNEDYQQKIWCARNYVCIITDGQPAHDQSIPPYVVDNAGNAVTPQRSLRDFDGDGADPCPCGIDPDYPCTSDDCGTMYPFNASGTAYLDDIAAYAFEWDMRTSEDMPFTQNIITHAVYIFENENIGRILMEKTASRGGGSSFVANNADELTRALEDIFGEVANAAMASSSVAVFSDLSSGSDSMLFVPYYKHTSWYEWYGNVRAFRMDQNGVIRDASGNEATDSDGSNDGLLDNPVWDAEVKLATKIATDGRTIFTYVPGEGQPAFTTANADTIGEYFDCDLNTNGVVDESEEVEALIAWIRGNDNPAGFDDLRARDGHYIGDIINSSVVYVGAPNQRFGQIYADSSYGNFAAANTARQKVIYVGANDGMLHCFDAGNGTTQGDELWAYIPYNLLPHLKWLTDPRYGHVYYVDLTARVWDINLGTTSNPNWRSLLVGGMRLGGTPVLVDADGDTVPETSMSSAIFCLDVTDPVNPVVKWEIVDNRFGYTTSMPIAVRVNDVWYIMFGSGPNDRDGNAVDQLGDGYTDSGAYVFVLNPDNGTIERAITPRRNEYRDNFFGSPVAVDYNQDYSVDVIYIGDAKGNMWRISTFNGTGYVSPDDWSIDVGGGNDESTARPLVSLDPIDYRQPMHTKPAVSIDTRGRLWIYWGTGRYFCMNDNTFCGIGNECPDGSGGARECYNTDPRGQTRSKFVAVGVYDRYYDADNTVWRLQTSTIHLNDLDERIILAGSVSGNTDLTGYGIVDRTYPDADIETDIDATTKGWFFQLLEEGERALGEFRIWGEVVFFLTFNPYTDITIDPCAYGPRSSNIYGVYYTSGTSPASPVFDLTQEGILDAEDTVDPGSGAKIPAGINKLLGPGFAGGSPIIRSFDGRVVAINPLGLPIDLGRQAEMGSGVTSWREDR